MSGGSDAASTGDDTNTVDVDSSVVTNMGACTSKAEPWRLCSVSVKLANGQSTQTYGDYW